MDLELLYPLGYLSTLAFALRFIVQWLYSEAKGQSLVIAPFWWLSLTGNLLLLIHSLIQMQFHVSLIQSINAVISWRNLDLMKPPALQKSFPFTLAFMALSSFSVTSFFFFTDREWFRIPDPQVTLFWGWHLIGLFGLILFSFRFVLQWWEAEKAHTSLLGAPFWIMSLAGGALSVIYFSLIHDGVNLIGPLFGMIPYARNLILIAKKKRRVA